MNKEDNEDNDDTKIVRKSLSSKTQKYFKSKFNVNKPFNLTEKNNGIINELGIEHQNIKKGDKSKNNQTNKIFLEIPEYKIKRKKKRIISKLVKQEIKLNRIKNLYDSNDDELGDDDNRYIINPETKIIFFYDFLIILFLYIISFIQLLISVDKNVFCSSNKNINFSDSLLFINDILYILDLILSLLLL